MKRFVPWALGLGLATSASALTPSTSNVFRPEQKPAGREYQNPPERVQGDTVEYPLAVSALPFSSSGNTCVLVNDYDYACPYPNSTSPDVVYRFVPTADVAIDVDLCASAYDTKVYVFENTVGNVIACNDDYCAFQSLVHNVQVTSGDTYYIVIDGYGGSCGVYHMIVSEHEPCVLECPAGAMLEDEPDCYEGYDDTYNGGCNVYPFPVFQVLVPTGGDITICGTTGVFMMDTVTTYRDTDWFQMDITETSYICLSGDAEVPCYYIIIDGRGGCSGTGMALAYGTAGSCAPVSDICYPCDPGTWWAWVAPNAWDPSFACGSLYNLTIAGYDGSTPVESTTWGRVKGMFR